MPEVGLGCSFVGRSQIGDAAHSQFGPVSVDVAVVNVAPSPGELETIGQPGVGLEGIQVDIVVFVLEDVETSVLAGDVGDSGNVCFRN